MLSATTADQEDAQLVWLFRHCVKSRMSQVILLGVKLEEIKSVFLLAVFLSTSDDSMRNSPRFSVRLGRQVLRGLSIGDPRWK